MSKFKEYGALPEVIGLVNCEPKEMFFYQYLPIKLAGSYIEEIPKRLMCLSDIIEYAVDDFRRSIDPNIVAYNIYLTAKNMYQNTGESYNRLGWRSDGFMTNDINYIWSNNCPTIFSKSKFNITPNDEISLKEMNKQAKPKDNVTYPNNTLLMLDQYNIHRVSEETFSGMRAFVKISFSKDKYDLIGNSHNYALHYDWEMRGRKQERNIPQKLITHAG